MIKNVIIPPYTKIGICKEDDVKRGFFVSNGGVTIVAKESILEESLPFEDKDDGEKV